MKKILLSLFILHISHMAISQCGVSTTDQPLSVTNPVLCDSGNTTINLANSQIGVRYFLRNNANNAVVGAQVEGLLSGGSISLNTGVINSTTTFNVWASQGWGIDFDGVDDYLSLGNPPQFGFSGDFSIELWMKMDNISPVGRQSIIGKDVSGARQLSLQYNTGRLKILYYSGGQPVYLDSDMNPIKDNLWHHVVAQKTGSSLEIYLDGVLIKQGTTFGVHGPMDDYPSELRIGSREFTNFEDYFDGQLDDVRIWNYARSPSQIANERFMDLTGSEAGLVGYWNMEDGVFSTIATDLTANSNHGTLTNMNFSSDWVAGIIGLCDTMMTDTVTVVVGTAVSNTQELNLCIGDSIFVGANAYYQSGIYVDTLSTTIGCDSILTTSIAVVQLPTPNLGNDTTICYTDTLLLDPGSFTSYNWSLFTSDTSIVVASPQFSTGTHHIWVEVTDDNSCVNSDSIIVTLDACTGIEDNYLLNEQVLIYPNPNKGTFSFNLTGENVDFATIQVLNTLGEIVINKEHVNLKENNKIDMKNMPKGLYFFRVISGKAIIVERFIIE